jgi:hypothetical protein
MVNEEERTPLQVLPCTVVDSTSQGICLLLAAGHMAAPELGNSGGHG